MIVAIAICGICILFIGMLIALISAGEKETLDERAECIRKMFEAKDEKKRLKEERRRRRHDKWHG